MDLHFFYLVNYVSKDVFNDTKDRNNSTADFIAVPNKIMIFHFKRKIIARIVSIPHPLKHWMQIGTFPLMKPNKCPFYLLC